MPPRFRLAHRVRSTFHSLFPNLQNVPWFIKSPWNDDYQCIAWAACRTDVAWWPVDGHPAIYWPPEAALDDSVYAFIHAFARIGYLPCDNPDFEIGYQKVAIYATRDGHVTHMARQQFFGRGWLSKCGKLEDILHPNLYCIEGDPSPWLAAMGRSYGRVRQILKRNWWVAFGHLGIIRCFWAASSFWLYRLVHPSWIWNNILRKYEK